MKKGDKVQLNEKGYKGYNIGQGSELKLRNNFGYAIINRINKEKIDYISVDIYNVQQAKLSTIEGCASWFEPYEEPFDIDNTIDNLNKLEIKLKKDE